MTTCPTAILKLCQSTKLKKISFLVKYLFILFVGVVVACVFTVITAISIPIYLYRYVIVFAAKKYRSDLGPILTGQCALVANDYFYKEKPRAHIVLSMVFEGTIEVEKVKDAVLKTWIPKPGQTKIPPSYARFHQYPIRWKGFTFWKNESNAFNVNSHVSLLSSADHCISQDQLDTLMEKVLNTRFPEGQSPWQAYIIENYKPDFPTDKQHSVVTLAWHHCITDGVGMMIALLEVLGETLQLPKIQFPKRKGLQKILFAIAFPINYLHELGTLACRMFEKNPFKVTDSQKAWYQVCAKSKPVSIETLKQVKNHFQVSFTSVLISAISAASHRFLIAKNNIGCKENNALSFASVLPMPGPIRNPGLNNYVTFAVFDLPIENFASAGNRLKSSDKVLKNKRDSVFPYLIYHLTCLFGFNLYPIGKIMCHNRYAPLRKSQTCFCKLIFQIFLAK